ncbi:cupin domain-containing protein [uncultured Hyphomicrobium sp.]|uniref:cupin domain-containing protein n=1 Tax=uncultured Hyphomicrobium sp. TaxID=194373 RepID=UPI0025FBDD67|nr:cupin domain-containing protein [uncultured Hyphomicrobium sp.]
MAVIHDPMRVPPRTGTIYPKPFDEGFDGRLKRALTERLGLTQFGVNLTTLQPGAKSSHRHWHENEDEFIYMLEGELVLVTKDGEQVLRPSMAVAFAAGDKNGHQLVNRSSARATYLEIGTRAQDEDITYPDIDLRAEKRAGRFRFFRKTGEPYE